MNLDEEQILEIALKAIHKYCKLQTNESNENPACKDCPFIIHGDWDYCMFTGPYQYEGAVPEDWALSELEFMKKGEDES